VHLYTAADAVPAINAHNKKTIAVFIEMSFAGIAVE
jgi:hypothetical protein